MSVEPDARRKAWQALKKKAPDARFRKPERDVQHCYCRTCFRYPEFYGNISAGHFVVTAAAGHDYEFDKATSTVRFGVEVVFFVCFLFFAKMELMGRNKHVRHKLAEYPRWCSCPPCGRVFVIITSVIRR